MNAAEAFEFGFSGIATHRIWGPRVWPVCALRHRDQKGRPFEGVENGRTVTAETGGAYSELWFGPLVCAAAIFSELAMDCWVSEATMPAMIYDEAGDTDNPLRTSKTVAWLLNLGGDVPINETVSLALRLEYRVRYYDRRDKPLVDKLVHGTQNFTPFIGIGWTPQ